MLFHSTPKGFVPLSSLAGLLLSFPFVASGLLEIVERPFIYPTVSESPAKETVLVLGAAAYPHRLSDVLQDRMDTAVELYQVSKAKTLVLSGAANEVETMTEYALGQGVKREDLEQDPEGLNTALSFRHAAARHRSLAVATQAYHLPRALFLARNQGIDAIGVAADRGHTYTDIFEFRKRELLAASKAMLEFWWKFDQR